MFIETLIIDKPHSLKWPIINFFLIFYSIFASMFIETAKCHFFKIFYSLSTPPLLPHHFFSFLLHPHPLLPLFFFFSPFSSHPTHLSFLKSHPSSPIVCHAPSPSPISPSSNSMVLHPDLPSNRHQPNAAATSEKMTMTLHAPDQTSLQPRRRRWHHHNLNEWVQRQAFPHLFYFLFFFIFNCCWILFNARTTSMLVLVLLCISSQRAFIFSIDGCCFPWDVVERESKKSIF